MNKILLIENENSGKSYVELVKKMIENIEVTWVRNHLQAVEEIKKGDYKIVVYDQRLDNNELGTETMLELKRIDKDLLGIMLSAYATPDDTTQAGKDGILFDYCNKRVVQNLPQKIMDALRAYDINKALNMEQEKHYIGKLFRKHSLFHPQKFYIVSKKLVDPKFVFEDSWKDLYMINAGEEQYHKKSIELSTDVKVNYETHSEQSSDISIDKLNQLIGSKFQTSLEISTSNSYERQSKEIEEIVKAYKMPPIPESVSEDYLTTTILQGGQVYKQYDIEVLQECSLCENVSFHHFTVYVPTFMQKLRKINTYRYREQEIIEVSLRT